MLNSIFRGQKAVKGRATPTTNNIKSYGQEEVASAMGREPACATCSPLQSRLCQGFQVYVAAQVRDPRVVRNTTQPAKPTAFGLWATKCARPTNYFSDCRWTFDHASTRPGESNVSHLQLRLTFRLRLPSSRREICNDTDGASEAASSVGSASGDSRIAPWCRQLLPFQQRKHVQPITANHFGTIYHRLLEAIYRLMYYPSCWAIPPGYVLQVNIV